ncbi:relaxase/mobilization nuclease domain-containing protein [Burkholderia sp. MSMB1459WGS]|uniref:relaxase/mobilization nuclease domain-containing protein n=1 Tax=Burkholderia sp. MSMB1459WGS TaxID=1637970 RepID=UPI0009E80484|nr:relaxase/mobilization nuclease domain-containing protein [Burkholderia sp. MSMB1459WGS]
MPFAKTYVDALLVNWGDRLFREPLRHVSAPQLARGILPQHASLLREKLGLTLRRAPEVMVKISNKATGAQGMGTVRRHLQYISRNGNVELEDQDGHMIAGKLELNDLLEQWHLSGWGIPQDSKRRETLNVLLSMPPGTNRQAVRDAARAFAHEIFGDGRLYVFAEHDDEAHPHVHLSVHTRGPDGRRLNPRNQDLRDWRETFARRLREYGVDANATPRMARGQTQRFPKRGAVWMVRQGTPLRFPLSAPNEETQQFLWNIHLGSLIAWHEIAKALAHSDASEDRTMAMDIADFVLQMPIRALSPNPIPQHGLMRLRHENAHNSHRAESKSDPQVDQISNPSVELDR